MELYRFTRADVVEIVQTMHRDWHLLSKRARTLRSAELRFRDEKGEYWMADVRSLDWYRNDQGRWVLESPSVSDGTFEGPFSILSLSTASLKEPREPRRRMSKPKSEIQSVEWGILSARDAYRDGEITSTSAETLAWGQHVIGKDGVARTVGLQSGGWFSFVDNNWRKSHLPEMDMLTRYEDVLWCPSCKQAREGSQVCPGCGGRLLPKLAETTDDTYTALRQYLTSGYSHPPEPVTDPWNPPDIPSAMISETETGKAVVCSKCATVLPSDSLFCRECGAPARVGPTKTVEPTPKNVKLTRSAHARWHVSVGRMLVGILLSVAASACFPYVYYLAVNIRLDPTTALGVIFVLSLLIAFGIVAFPLMMHRTPTLTRIVTAPVESRFCGNCGSRLASEDKFCGDCGTPNT